jgi:nitrile hydratase subunit beta
MPGAHYLESSYYEHWLHAIESILLDNGAVTEAELQRRIAELRQAAASAENR